MVWMILPLLTNKSMKNMKLNTLLYSLAVLTAGLVVASCQKKEESDEAKAVATSETYVEFAPSAAPEQTISVYSDGAWAVDVDSDWITVSPMSGSGMGSITISVTDNFTGEVMGAPREGIITIQGRFRERKTLVTVHQNGDNYYGVQEMNLAAVAALDNNAVAKIPSVQVIALTKSGFIVFDESAKMYIKGVEDVEVGDIVSFNGKKVELYGAAAFEADELEVAEHGTYAYPEAADLTSLLPSYEGGIVYGSLSGSLVNGTLKVGSANIQVVDPLDAVGLDAVDLHKVVLTGFAVGKSGATGYFVATEVTDEGVDETLIPYPLKWAMGKDLNYSGDTFTNDTPRIDPVQGIGYIEYVPFDLEHTDGAGNYKLDVSGNNPRVTGPWENDYWLFYGSGAIKAGTDVQIAFEMRSSKWGQKFWLLEYLDGEEWLAAGTPQTSTEPGTEVFYTCATNIDGATNCQVLETIHFRKNNDHLQIRLRCVVNWRGGGDPMTPSRSTASSRLSITNVDDDTYRPSVIILKEGDGVEKDPVYANIEVSDDLLTFNGTPGDPKTLTVTSDHDFTIATSYDWLTLDKEGGLAGEKTEIQVTCAQSELSELRQGTIRIVSEDSEKVINVVQSAAGQILDPFISVTQGNHFSVEDTEGSKTLKIQSNVEVSAESLASWITVVEAGTKAMVEWKEYEVSYEANTADTERTGQVRFFNTAKNQEAIVTFVQAAKEPEPEYPEGVFFQDDFEWLKPFVEAYVQATPADADKMDPVGSNLASHAQPNIWSLYASENELAVQLVQEFTKRGYTDLNPTAATLYLQKNYFKMGASNKHTGLQLPAIKFGDTPVDAEFSFDWCAHMTGKGAIDDVTITVEIVEGPGTFAGTDTQVSAPFATTQTTNTLAWQHASVVLKGVTNATRIQIHPTHYKDGAGASQQRWHLDNIVVEKYVKPVTFPVVWSFKDPGDDWKDGVDWHCENPTGSYVYSDTHDGKLSVVRFGGTPVSKGTEQKPTYKKDDPLGTRLLHYGMYKDDYWLFEVEGVKNAAGTYTIGYGCCSSAAGPKFFALEYSLDNGTTWTGINTKKESITLKTGADARDVTYTYAISPTSNTANEVCVVTESFHLNAFKGKLMVRARVADTMKLDKSAEMSSATHAGTNRIGNQAQIIFTAD